MSVPTTASGRLAAASYAREGALSSTYPFATYVEGNLFPYMVPPGNFNLKMTPLFGNAIGAGAETPNKSVIGPSSLDGGAWSSYLEPTDELGNLLFALMGTDTVLVNGDSTWTHQFTRSQTSIPPTYSWHLDKKNQQQAFLGCALDSLKLEGTPKGLVIAHSMWKGLGNATDPGSAITWAPSAKRQPIPWSKTKITVASAQRYDVTKWDMEFKNGATLEHVIQDSTNQAGRIFWTQMEVDINATVLFEEHAEYDKFIANTLTAWQFDFTAFENIGATSIKHKFKVLIPYLAYEVYDSPINTGVLSATIKGKAIPELTASVALPSTPTGRNCLITYTNGTVTAFS